MMEIKDVLFFDCETTGIPERSAKWNEDYMDYPHIVQLAWMIEGKTESYVVRPEGWEIPENTVEIHGITTEQALKVGVPFAVVVDLFLADCLSAGLLAAHNIHFDTSIIKANILRELGEAYYKASGAEEALFKGKRIDTMQKSMKWVDARTSNGRLKFPRLEELYSRCFPGETFPAHDALEDVKAVARCLPILIEQGLIELQVKEYPEEQPNNPISAFVKIADAASNAAKIAADAVKKFGATPEIPILSPNSGIKTENDKLPSPTVETPKTEDFPKITPTVVDRLLEQDNF